MNIVQCNYVTLIDIKYGVFFLSSPDECFKSLGGWTSVEFLLFVMQSLRIRSTFRGLFA